MCYEICPRCNGEKKPGTACTSEPVVINNANVPRLPFGKDGAPDINGQMPRYCPSCNTPVDGYHHFGCDFEECPNCGRQLLSCGCVKR